MDWEKAVSDNLIPLSQEQEDLGQALDEWHYSEGFIDYGIPCETCQLCSRTGLRYHFEILNTETQNTLLVGSTCISRFDIAAHDEQGRKLKGKERDKILQEKIKAAKVEQAVQPLRGLWQADKGNRDLVEYCATTIKDGKGLSPDEMLDLFKCLDKHELSYDPQLYKVDLRSIWDKDQVLAMSEQDRQTIWAALVSRQQIAIAQHKKKAEEAEIARQEALKQAEIEAEVRRQQVEQYKKRAEKAEIERQKALAYRIKQAEERRQHIKQRQQKTGDAETLNQDPLTPVTQPAETQKQQIEQMQKTLQPQDGEVECELCGQMTTEWYAFSNRTKKCRCMDCYKRLDK